jgi:hypothetical protein
MSLNNKANTSFDFFCDFTFEIDFLEDQFSNHIPALLSFKLLLFFFEFSFLAFSQTFYQFLLVVLNFIFIAEFFQLLIYPYRSGEVPCILIILEGDLALCEIIQGLIDERLFLVLYHFIITHEKIAIKFNF